MTSSTGDLAVATNSLLGQQRLLRRLLTNLGDYLWHLDYGGGLGAYVGECAADSEISAVIRAQMVLEASVSQSPEPTVDITLQSSTGNGSVYVQITYQEAQVDSTEVLLFSLNSTPS